MNKNKGREETKQHKVLKAKLLEAMDRNVISRSSQSLLDVRLPVCLFSEDLTGMRVEFPKTKQLVTRKGSFEICTCGMEHSKNFTKSRHKAGSNETHAPETSS